MPPVKSADRDMLSAPRRNPNVGPMTRAARINRNHIGSIPIAPIPSGLKAATKAERIPKKATFFEPRSSVATRETIRKMEIVVEIRKNHSARLARACDVAKKGQRNPMRVDGINSATEEYRKS
jgi:hypothetical protein